MKDFKLTRATKVFNAPTFRFGKGGKNVSAALLDMQG